MSTIPSHPSYSSYDGLSGTGPSLRPLDGVAMVSDSGDLCFEISNRGIYFGALLLRDYQVRLIASYRYAD